MSALIHDLRCGRWQDVLAAVSVDSIVTDPPYSDRTHEGRRTGSEVRTSSIAYPPLTREQVTEFVTSWDGRVREWWIIFGDHVSSAWWREELDRAGKYVFAPVVWAKPDAPPRMSGDGPQSSCEHITVARERHMPDVVGSRPGHYLFGSASARGNNGVRAFPGAKPVQLIRQILRDYTKPGDVIADPFAGTNRIMLACRLEGRGCVASECDPETYAEAMRLGPTGADVDAQPDLFGVAS